MKKAQRKNTYILLLIVASAMLGTLAGGLIF